MNENPGDIYLGPIGQEIKLYSGARTVTPTFVEESNSQRTASKKLVTDIIRRYTNYQIDYEIMTGPIHDELEALYKLGQNLNLIVVNRDGSHEESTVKMSWTPGTRESVAGNWLWSGVSITLEVV